jgi:hypothetical protein
MEKILICRVNHKSKLEVVKETTKDELVEIRSKLARAKEIESLFYRRGDDKTGKIKEQYYADCQAFNDEYFEWPLDFANRYLDTIVIPFENL